MKTTRGGVQKRGQARIFKGALLICLVLGLIFGGIGPVGAKEAGPYEGIHLYIILDVISVGEEAQWMVPEYEIAGYYTDFMDGVKADNPKNKVTVILNNDHEGSFNFFGNYGRFDQQAHVPFNPEGNDLRDSLDVYESLLSQEEAGLKTVVLFADSDGGLFNAYEDYSKDPDPYKAFDQGMTRAVDDFTERFRSIPGDPAVYSLQVDYYLDYWGGGTAYEDYIYEGLMNYSRDLFKNLANRHYRLVSNGTPEELEKALVFYREELKKEIQASDQDQQGPFLKGPLMGKKDFWSFKNFIYRVSNFFEQIFGIKEEAFKSPYVQERLAGLSPVDRALIQESKKKKNMGNCYGMSLSAVLAYEGALEKERIPLRDEAGRVLTPQSPLREATKASGEEVINFYQNTFGWKEAKVPQTLHYPRTHEQAVDMLIEAMKTRVKEGGSGVVLYYGQDKKKIYHAVVAYDMDYQPGEAYDYVVHIYDSNDPQDKKGTRLWLNSKTHAYKMNGIFPFDQESGYIYGVIDDPQRMDPQESYTGSHQTIMTLSGQAQDLEVFQGGRRWRIDQDNLRASGLDILPIPAGPGPDQAYVVILPETDQAYGLRPLGGQGEDLEVSLVYKDQLISVSAHQAAQMTFYPEGRLDLKEAQGDLEIRLVQNKAQGGEALDYQLKGQGQGDLSFSQDPEGLSIQGDLDQVQVYSENEGGQKTTASLGSIEGSYLFKGSGSLAQGPFRDVNPWDWFYLAVDHVYNYRMMKGVAPDRFDPQGTITRAQMAQIVYNLGGRGAEKKTPSPSRFSDVGAQAWYKEAVDWAAKEGIVKGYGDRTFRPEDPISREQAMTILYRYLKGRGEIAPVSGEIKGFKDSKEVSPYAREALAWATTSGAIQGDPQGYLHPKATTKRSEMAQILLNLGGLLVR
ncbi:MAG: S-layer homology domain-containing protein [Tissierellia bacterium]|nr:S-layer homology domain-containing protein [Tissierellia bacterium]